MRNWLRRLFRVKYVLVSIKDINIDSGKVTNTLYSGKDSFYKYEIPLSKFPNLEFNQQNGNHLAFNVGDRRYLIKILGIDRIYDALSGDLEQVIIYSNLSK